MQGFGTVRFHVLTVKGFKGKWLIFVILGSYGLMSLKTRAACERIWYSCPIEYGVLYRDYIGIMDGKMETPI